MMLNAPHMPAAEAVPAMDGMILVPGGLFNMGSNRHYEEEKPVHRVRVDGFFMDVHDDRDVMEKVHRERRS